jgi:hypothetical protein
MVKQYGDHRPEIRVNAEKPFNLNVHRQFAGGIAKTKVQFRLSPAIALKSAVL